MFNSVVMSVVLAKFWRFRTIAAVMLACSACKPLLSTDSSPANPELNQAIALARPYTQSGISLSPPAQWQSVKIPGMRYTAFIADPANPSSSSISLMEDRNPMSLASYIDTNLKELKTAFPNSSKFQRTTFTTQAGMTATVVSIDSPQLGKIMQQRFYFFAPSYSINKDTLTKNDIDKEVSSDRKLVAVCTGTSQIEVICNASIKTLRVTP
jgi:hypothetical protein